MFFASGNERSFDGSFLRIGPVDHHVLGVKVNTFNSALVLDDFEQFHLFGQKFAVDFFSGAEQKLRFRGLVGAANSAELIRQSESFNARAGVRAVHVGAGLSAVVTEGETLVDVDAFLRIVFVHHVTAIAEAKVAGAVGQVVAPVLTTSSSSFNFVFATSGLVTTLFVGPVSAVVLQVADLGAVDAVTVGALEVAEQVRARSGSVCAEGHVVLVRTVATVVFAVADVVPGNALEVIALELLDLVAGKVLAEFFRFVRVVAAIVLSVAKVSVVDADVVLALVLVFGAVSAVGISRRAILFVGQIRAIPFTVALQLGLDAVAGVALEAILLARVSFAVLKKYRKPNVKCKVILGIFLNTKPAGPL